MTMTTRPFERWLFEQVEIEFGIVRIKNMPSLLQWLFVSAAPDLLPPEFEKLRLLLENDVEILNEDELKMLFIGPFLSQFDFHHPPFYRVFTQRTRSIKTKNVESSGRVEWMVATGKQIPNRPFFFLQEYKPEKTSGNDPLGQLLVAMMEAQSRNDNVEQPLYGCYTIGRFWFFVLLKGKEYGVSRAYDATQSDDMSDMVVILKKVERHIHEVMQIP